MTAHLSNKQIVDALLKTRGGLYLAARELGCAPKTIYNRMDKYPIIKQIIEDARGETVDIAEQKLRNAILNGEPWAIALELKTIGKNRGYVEKQEVANEGEVKVLIEYANDPYQVRPSSPGTIGGDSEPKTV